MDLKRTLRYPYDGSHHRAGRTLPDPQQPIPITMPSPTTSSVVHRTLAALRTLLSRYLSTRDDILFAVVWVALTVAYLRPLLGNEFVPSQDTPCHLSMVRIWSTLHTDPFMQAHYMPRPGYQPYIVHYALLRGLSALMSLETSNTLLLSAYAVTLPLSLLYLFTRFGKDKRYALLAFPFIYNTYFINGFDANLIALPMLFWILGQLKGYLDTPTVRRELLLTASLLLLSFTHVLVLASFAISAPIIYFAHVRRPLPILRKSLFVWPSAIAAGIWAMSQAGGKPIDGNWLTFKQGLAFFLAWAANIFQDGADEFMEVVIIVTVGVLLVMPADEANQRSRRAWTLPAAGLALFVAFLALPFEMRNPAHWATNVRLVIPAVLLGLAVPRVRLTGWRQLAILPAVGAMFWFANNTWDKFHEFSQKTHDLDTIIAAIPPNQRVLSLVYDERDDVNQCGVYRHIAQLYQVRKGGYLPRGFTRNIEGQHGPILQRHHTPTPQWKHPRKFRWDRYGRYYDYFIAVLPRKHTKGWTTFPGAGNHVKLVAKRGRFAAYKKVRD